MPDARLPALLALDAVALTTLRPNPGALRRGLAEPARWVAEAGADRVLAQLAVAALWLAAAWLGAGLLAGVLARLPGTAGRIAGRVAGIALPAVLRRVVAGSAGVGLLLAPAVASAQTDHSAPGPVVSRAAMNGSATGLAQAGSSPGLAPGRPDPGPVWPTGDGHRARPAAATVRAGDCLWLLAARRLGPDAGPARVASYTRAFYAANRSVVGADPDLIAPGQVLRLPDPATVREESP